MNKCGVKVEHLLDAIKSVEKNGNVQRKDFIESVSKYLEKISPNSNAKEIRDMAKEAETLYFGIYKKKIDLENLDNISRDGLTDKRAIKAYLTGEINEIPQSDIAEINEIHKQLDTVQTQSERAKLEEKARNIQDKWDKDYNNKIVQAFLYTNPLLSVAFNLKVLRSNPAKMLLRSLQTRIYFDADGKIKVDKTWSNRRKILDDKYIPRFGGLRKALEVLKGGVPQETLISNEIEIATSRREEYKLKDDTSNLKRVPLEAYKKLTQLAARLMNAVDAVGLYHSNEIAFYELLKSQIQIENKANGINMTQNEIEKNALKRMYENSEQAITDLVDAQFESMGIELTKEFKNSNRYKLAKAEATQVSRKIGREILFASAESAKRDFWKARISQESELGFGDSGFFGLWSRQEKAARDAMIKIGNEVSGRFGETASTAMALQAFGYINGKNNFREDRLEAFLLYGLLKNKALQKKISKGENTEVEISQARRLMRDNIAKGVYAPMQMAIMYAVLSAIKNKLCPEVVGVIPTTDKDNIGKPAYTICGYKVPLLLAEQYGFIQDLMMLAHNKLTSKNDTSLLEYLYLLSESMLTNFYVKDSFGENIRTYVKQGSNNKKTEINEVKDELSIMRLGVNESVKYITSTIPIPYRLIKEANVIYDPINKLEKRAIKKDTFQNVMFELRHALANSLGLKDVSFVGVATNKPILDYLGREVWKYTGRDVIGDGIQYTEADEWFAKLDITPMYMGKLSHTRKDENGETRFLTDTEWINVWSAKAKTMGDIFLENKNGIFDKIKSKPKEEQIKIVENIQFRLSTLIGKTIKNHKGNLEEKDVEKMIKSSSVLGINYEKVFKYISNEEKMKDITDEEIEKIEDELK